jgi:putative transposase
MSRKGTPYDDRMMKRFYASLKQELIHHEPFADRHETPKQGVEYVEVFYNRQRRHSGLDCQCAFIAFQAKSRHCAKALRHILDHVLDDRVCPIPKKKLPNGFLCAFVST